MGLQVASRDNWFCAVQNQSAKYNICYKALGLWFLSFSFSKPANENVSMTHPDLTLDTLQSKGNILFENVICETET